MSVSQSTARKATNVSLPETLVREAKDMGINISKACEAGLAEEIAEERRRRWKAENAEAMAQHGAWVENHGLPLAEYRAF